MKVAAILTFSETLTVIFPCETVPFKALVTGAEKTMFLTPLVKVQEPAAQEPLVTSASSV